MLICISYILFSETFPCLLPIFELDYFFLILSFESSLYNPAVSTLSDMWHICGLQIFSSSLKIVFSSFQQGLSQNQFSFKFWWIPIYQFFSFIVCAFGVISMTLHQALVPEIFSFESATPRPHQPSLPPFFIFLHNTYHMKHTLYFTYLCNCLPYSAKYKLYWDRDLSCSVHCYSSSA